MSLSGVALVGLVVLAVAVLYGALKGGPKLRRGRIAKLLQRRRERCEVRSDMLVDAAKMLSTRRARGYRSGHEVFDDALLTRASELLASVASDVATAEDVMDDVARAVADRQSLDSTAFAALEQTLLHAAHPRCDAIDALPELPRAPKREPARLHEIIDDANRNWITVSILLDLVAQHLSHDAALALVHGGLEEADDALLRAKGKRARRREPLQSTMQQVRDALTDDNVIVAIELLPPLHRYTRSVDAAATAAAGKRNSKTKTSASARAKAPTKPKSTPTVEFEWYEPRGGS